MEFLGECFYGVWYWYTWFKSKTIKRFKVFGWNFIKKSVFFFIFEQLIHNNIFFEGKNHYHIKEEEIL